MLYDRTEEKIDIIITLLSDKYYTYGDGKMISDMTGIPQSTISLWRKKLMILVLIL